VNDVECSRRPHIGCPGAHASRTPAAALLLVLLVPVAAAAQSVTTAVVDPTAPAHEPRVWTLGSERESRARDRQLVERRSTAGWLLRSASSAGGRVAPGDDGVTVVAPSLRVVWNSELPYSLNDGALWAGRGWSGLVRAGVDARRGRVRLVLQPELTIAENRAFELRPNRDPSRSTFAWPWGCVRCDIDLPSRFGDRTWRLLSPGQSALTVDVGPIVAGVATENDWWGPGVRNALLLSNNAEGVPHALVRTRAPLRTRIGEVEARWSLGVLTPSLYIDSAPLTHWRSLNSVAATLRPSALPSLTVGIARSVVTPIPSRAGVAVHALDALLRWSPVPSDTTRNPNADQYTSLFARWVLAAARTELYAEWARQGTPRSFGEVLLAPHDAGAITLGARSLQPLGGANARSHVRLGLELTSVEQSYTFHDRPVPPPFYAGRATREGYTQRGQVLGAAIGPGGSSQWLGADLVRGSAEVGLSLARVRWNNDVMYLHPNANFFRHDVSTLLGARAAVATRMADVAIDVTSGRRYNYLFQNSFAEPGSSRTLDVPNLTFALSVTPR
jgi:hypothetical protein